MYRKRGEEGSVVGMGWKNAAVANNG